MNVLKSILNANSHISNKKSIFSIKISMITAILIAYYAFHIFLLIHHFDQPNIVPVKLSHGPQGF